MAKFEKRAATIAHRLIALEPAKALADACGGIPVELAEVVLYEYVGLFPKVSRWSSLLPFKRCYVAFCSLRTLLKILVLSTI